MKKLFYVLAVTAFVACNNSGEGDKTEKDSIEAVDSAAKAAKDSIEHSSDSLKNVVDSSAGAKKDSIKK